MNPENILAAAAHPDPYPYYAGLLGGPALVFDAGNRFWVAVHAGTIREALGNPALRVRPGAQPVPPGIVGSPAGEVFGQLVRMNDGPAHEAPKRALQAFLARMDPAHVQARAQAVARAVAAAITGSPVSAGAWLDSPLRGSSLTAWMTDVPVRTMAGLLGFHDEQCAQVARWTESFTACLSPLSGASELQAAGAGAAALRARFSELARQADARPASALALLQEDARRSGWADSGALPSNLVGLLSQTFEATAGLLGNCLLALAARPGLLAPFAESTGRPGRWMDLVQEVARHDPAIHNTRRFAAAPATLAGVQLAAGDAVLLVLGAAGRDPQSSAQPGEFRLDRSSRTIPGFGHGPHQCPGQALAFHIVAGALDGWMRMTSAPSAALPAEWHYRRSLNARVPVFTA